MGAFLQSQYGQKPLENESLTIGSGADNQLVLYDPQADAYHAEIRPIASGYAIMDRGSANGTFINGQRLTANRPYTLNPGDTIRIGAIDFTYQMQPYFPDDATEPAYPASMDASPATEYAPPSAYPVQGAGQPGFNPAEQPQFPDRTVSANAPAVGYAAQAANQPAFNQAGRAQFPDHTVSAGQSGSRRQPLLLIGLAVVALIGGFLVFFLLRGGGGAPAVDHNATSTAVSVQKTAVSATSVAVSATGTAASAEATGTAISVIAAAGPQGTLQAYCAALEGGNAQVAYALLSPQAQKSISEPLFAAALQLTATKGGIKNCVVKSVKTNGSKATAVVAITTGDGKTTNENETLEKDQGVWKLDLRNTNF